MEQKPPLPRETAFRDNTRVRVLGQDGIFLTWWLPYRFTEEHHYALRRDGDLEGSTVDAVMYAEHDELTIVEPDWRFCTCRKFPGHNIKDGICQGCELPVRPEDDPGPQRSV
jgi:hypothetical protein